MRWCSDSVQRCRRAGAERGDVSGSPFRLIVPYPPGGSDVIPRMLAPRMSEGLGQQVVIDNRAGAATIIDSRFQETILENEGLARVRNKMRGYFLMLPMREPYCSF
jgi:hypothetical protein